ncbi:hypothetical protein EYF80_013685 [Liparis tanakae]|uniref:Uncharacterized protein n=1 Tax=Liparis tanakae TaxID=230148 RepID=A0A4Z2IFC6_9TELE|nr:hypothetical protein EYF80_013685 [Liparis tanakae]
MDLTTTTQVYLREQLRHGGALPESPSLSEEPPLPRRLVTDTPSFKRPLAERKCEETALFGIALHRDISTSAPSPLPPFNGRQRNNP